MQHGTSHVKRLIEHRRVTIPILLIVVLTVGAGAVHLEQESGMPAFTIGSEEEAALVTIESDFTTAQENVTVAQVIVEDENVLTKESLRASLELQQDIRANWTVAPTLASEPSTVGIANLVAMMALEPEGQIDPATQPPIDEQIDQLAALDQARIDAILERLLQSDDPRAQDTLALLPVDYNTGSITAPATTIVVFQDDEINAATGQAPAEIINSQQAIDELATDSPLDTTTVGNGLLSGEMDQANEETFLLLGPLALVFVLGTLIVAYRDLVDILLSLGGILLVLLWTFGALGWLGIAFNPVLIAVPVLLIGLSIDFGIHVLMRYREAWQRSERSVSMAMTVALSSVGVALLWVTLTTSIGFLSNLASPVPLIQEVGIIAAIGIAGALVVFAGLLPPIKVALDMRLAKTRLPRNHRSFSSNGGRITRLLRLGSTIARRAPLIVLVVAVVLTVGTTVAATGVSTTFESEDTVVEDAPTWTSPLPGPLAPSEYTAKENLEAMDERFVHPDREIEFLVEGSVTDAKILEDVATAEQIATQQEVVEVVASGEPSATTPLTVMERVAADDEEFAETFAAADTTGDGIPDQNIEDVYDALYAADPAAAQQVLSRSNGEYEALRLSISVDRLAQGETMVEEAEAIVTPLNGEERSVTATGSPIVNQIVEDSLLESLVVSFFVTLAVVGMLLGLLYRWVHGSATLGLVTLIPVLLTVSWIFGTMAVLGYPLNLLTALVASLAIGIGIDYSIHISERFRHELGRGKAPGDAISTTIEGTGGALLGSATTTTLGFGVLAFALVPILQQFGAIMGLMIIYAFVAAVFVLPSVLILWARYRSGALGTTTPSSFVDHSPDDD